MSDSSDSSTDASVQADASVARMISEGGAVASRPPQAVLEEQSSDSVERPSGHGAASDGAPGKTRASTLLSSQINKLWTKMANYALEKVAGLPLQTPPDVLEKASRRTRLAEDLLTEFKDGTYSNISKRSIAVIGSGLALASKLGEPSEPTVTRLGSACVSMLITEISAEDLRRYCRFKNYELQHYFG